MKINPNIKDINLTPIIGLDLETSGLDANKEQALVLAISTASETFVLELGRYTLEEIKNLLESIKRLNLVIAHNANFDVKFLYTNYGVLLENIHCTMLCEEVLNNRPGFKPFPSLIQCLWEHLKVELVDSADKKRLQQSFIGLTRESKLSLEQLGYAGDDTKYLIPLFNSQMKKAEEIEKMTGTSIKNVIKLENTLLPVIVKMELEGCLIDVEAWKKSIVLWEKKRDETEALMDKELLKLSKEYPKLCGKYTRERRKQKLTVLDIFGNETLIQNENLGNINYGSSDQLKEVFRLVGEPIPITQKKKKKDGIKVIEDKESLDEDSLKMFVNENPKSPLLLFVELLLELREYEKLVSTYGENFLEQLDENNFIHTSYTQCKTATGRLSSIKPNLQNLPSRGAGKIIRSFFIARPGYKMITCDMDSAEVAIAADYSGEELLLNSLLKGEDMHSKLSTISYSIIFKEKFLISKAEEPVKFKELKFVPDNLRTEHKPVVFAKFYKAGAYTIYKALAKYINLFHRPKDRLKIAGKISAALDGEMPQLTKYLTSVIKKATEQGYLVGSKLGRIRWFPPNPYGDAANLPIQNTNAEAMKISLINVDRYLEESGYGRVVMNIHDEVVCEVLEEKAEEAAQKIKEIVGDSLSYFLNKIKGRASAKINNHWVK
jgi:DNA polymerase I-like protein with 3'-5' exonuclease and polymerase domains